MLHKLLRKITQIITHKLFIVAILILFQLFWLLAFFIFLSEYFVIVQGLLLTLSIATTIYLLNKDENPTYKMTWIILILVVPLLGGMIYLIFGGHKVPKELRIKDHRAFNWLKDEMIQDENSAIALKNYDDSLYKQYAYLWNSASFPLYQNTQAIFLASGEAKFAKMKTLLKNAKKYIFLEYFIIGEGYMWNEILDILIEKVKEGLEVRIIYDDFGCSTTLPADYDKYLNELGIKTKVFNRLKAKLAITMNNRDHRKICIIDGEYAITGGVNLADEYINVKKRFGHWHDNAILIEGEAVKSFILMFLQFYNFDEKEKEDFDIYLDTTKKVASKGWVQPFSDTPTDDETIGKCVHLNMIQNSKEYLYITTPYLVIDYEMVQSLKMAAKSGVDVRIVVPHIPDKWYVFACTRSNYLSLIEAGVRIYEYSPGFIHAKEMISDDKVAFIGSVNMDYRSYYLHYECGCNLYNNDCILDMKEDYYQILEKSHEITQEDLDNVSYLERLIRSILNFFAPLF